MPGMSRICRIFRWGTSNPKQAGEGFRGRCCDPKLGVPKCWFGDLFCMRGDPLRGKSQLRHPIRSLKKYPVKCPLLIKVPCLAPFALCHSNILAEISAKIISQPTVLCFGPFKVRRTSTYVIHIDMCLKFQDPHGISEPV